jgi:hypothetical protein
MNDRGAQRGEEWANQEWNQKSLHETMGVELPRRESDPNETAYQSMGGGDGKSGSRVAMKTVPAAPIATLMRNAGVERMVSGSNPLPLKALIKPWLMAIAVMEPKRVQSVPQRIAL